MRKFLIFISASLLALACTSNEESGVPTEGRHEVTVRAGKTGPATKTSLGADGVSTVWCEDDSIALWAARDGAFALAGEKFRMKSLSPDASEATFSAAIDDMEEGTYTYYASYPYPAAIAGGVARFELPAVQDGTYRPEYDIMTAAPAEGASLQSHGCEPSLVFGHRMHIVKIYIPQGGNSLGEPIERIALTFPAPVAGTIETDMATSATTASGSNGVTLELATPIDAACGEAWAFINPLQMAEGDKFTVAVASRNETVSFDIAGRTLAAGHITPIRMVIPAPAAKETVLRFSVGTDTDYLGEPLQKLTLRGEKVDVANGADEVVLDMTGGYADLKVSSDNSYLADRTLEAVFESENAIVSGKVTVGNVEPGAVNPVSVATPYLFFEDFSGMNDDSDHDGSKKDSHRGDKEAYCFLDGWSGARIRLYQNTSIRIACYREKAPFVGNSMCYARVDSAPMSNLKAGASVSLTVTFDYGSDEERSTTWGIKEVGQICYVGHVEKPSIDTGFSSESADGVYEHQFTTAAGKNDGSSTVIPNTGSCKLTGCGKTSAISWRTYPADAGSSASNNHIYLYLDNIRVSIVN